MNTNQFELNQSLDVKGLPMLVRAWGLQDYANIYQAMHDFTQQRAVDTPDEIWWGQHYPVFTLGQATKPEHLLHTGDIPVIQANRGGQVTYHGPGQLVVYPLINIQRLGLNVRDFVSLLEMSIIDLLAEHYALPSFTQPGAPGVYTNTPAGVAKIASIGLRIKKGASFHGISLNIDMDLEPFQRINPCGYAGMPITQLVNCCQQTIQPVMLEQVAKYFISCLNNALIACNTH